MTENFIRDKGSGVGFVIQSMEVESARHNRGARASFQKDPLLVRRNGTVLSDTGFGDVVDRAPFVL